MRALERALAERARSQLGLVTRAQLFAIGFSRSQIDERLTAGWLDRHHANVYRLRGATPSWRQAVLGAVLAGGPEALASHEAAAVLHRLDGFTRAPVVVTSRRSRNFFPPNVVVHRPIVMMDVDRSVVDAVPVTSVALTLINLGAVCRPMRVEVALDGAIRDGLVTEDFMEWRLSQLGARGRPGIGVMRRLLATGARARRPDSYLERRFLRAWEATGLEPPLCQHEVRNHLGRHVARVDFYWPGLDLALEVDGHRHHATRTQRAADNARTLAMAALGILTVRLTYEQVCDTPERAASDVVAALRSRSRRGYAG